MKASIHIGQAVCALLLLVSSEAWSQGCTPRFLCEAVPKAYAYYLEVTGATPTNMVEHEPITVKYRLRVGSYGVSGPELTPINIKVCPKDQRMGTTCKSYDGVTAGRTFSGEVTAFAPAAGIAAPVTLVVVEQPVSSGETYAWPEQAEESIRLPVAARYEVALEEFEIQHTRSARTDTVWANLQGMVRSNPPHASASEDACKREGFHWCVMGSRYGDAQDGKHQLQNVRIGPYELVPEREDSLDILYAVYNYGDSYYQRLGEAVANGFSKVGMIVLMGYGVQSGNSTTSVATQLDEGMQELHAGMFAGCDGLSAVDLRVFSNKTIDNLGSETLDAWTRATGTYFPPFTGVYEGGEYVDNNTRCGAGGKYLVRYAVYRTSWRDWP
jgi:hypothetical protein